MRLEAVMAVVAGIPHMTEQQAETAYRWVKENRPSRILELGFAHGVSTCVFAAALDEVGPGTVTTYDQPAALDRRPNIRTLLDRAGLAERVDVMIDEQSYVWGLADRVQAGETFDLVYIDGAHTFEVDGFAFLLVDRLLAPGGTVLFDDLDWTLDSSRTLRETPWVKALPARQRQMAQVRHVFDTLVATHPDYETRIAEGWGWATKKSVASAPPARKRFGFRS